MRILFREASEVRHSPPGEGEICLWPMQAEDGGRIELASLVLSGGVDRLRRGGGATNALILPFDPTLDDMLASTIATMLVRQQELPSGIAAFARYAGLVREGLFPGKTPLESSLAGIYLAIRRDTGNADLLEPPAAERFLGQWRRLEQPILDAAGRGVNPAKDDFLGDDAEFERERAFLQRDHEVFDLDVSRGEQWPAQLPGGPADGFCLVLRQPRSILFKLWHRLPTENTRRYVLLAVCDAPGRWVFSTDPVFRFSLKPLAERLQELELTAAGEAALADPWFDGARFAHTMIATPHRGTQLSDEQLLQAVRAWIAGESGESEPADVDALVDQHADEFERQLKAGRRPDIAQALAEAPRAVAVPLLEEFLLLDGEYRIKNGGSASFEDYLRKYPQLREKILAVRGTWEQSISRLGSTLLTNKAVAGKSPKKIRRYVIIEQLPRSGQAELFRAVDPELRREVLIKWYFNAGESAEGVNSLKNEAAVLAKLNHRNLARIFGLDRYRGRPFLVMEFVAGMNLRHYAALKPLEPRRIARLIAQVARAVTFAHERSVLHLDIKPENILVDQAGQAKLIDFGLAQMQSAFGEHQTDAMIVGTPGYMPPEQASGRTDRLGPMSDTFSLGGVLYFLLTGKDPFAAPTIEQRLELARDCRWDREALIAANVPQELKDICAKAMSADPRERYSADALASALATFGRTRT